MLRRHWKLTAAVVMVLAALLLVLGYEIFVVGRETHVWLEPTGTDSAETVSGALVVDPGWQYGDLLQADLYADNETFPVPLTLREDGCYTGAVTLPLDASPIWMSLQMADSGSPELSQMLTAAVDTYALLPVQKRTWSGVSPVYGDGAFGLGGALEFGLQNWEAPGVQVRAPEFRLYRDDVLEETIPAQEQRSGRTYSYTANLEEPVLVSCGPGEELCLTFACRDDFGLAYEFAYDHWLVTADGLAEQAAFFEDPVLTWPE